MTKKFYAHHGDIDLFTVDKLPKKYKYVGKTKSHTPQQSDVTGHSHTITSNQEFEVYQAEDFAYILTSDAQITHQEHRTLDIKPGTYIILRELEEDARDGVVKEVVD